MSIIGIILGTIAIGLFIWLKNDQQMSNSLHEGDLEAAKHAFEALQEEFSHYQIDTDRKISDLEKQLEIKTRQSNNAIDRIQKDLPPLIERIVSRIEFAKIK